MRLPRPYIPHRIRRIVAVRQCIDAFVPLDVIQLIEGDKIPEAEKCRRLLSLIFPDQWVELDHVPSLAQRAFNMRTRRYTPDANEQAYLVWRPRSSHYIKTYIRGDGAQRSDVAQRRYLKRIEAKRKPKRKFKPRPARHIRRSHASVIPWNDNEIK